MEDRKSALVGIRASAVIEVQGREDIAAALAEAQGAALDFIEAAETAVVLKVAGADLPFAAASASVRNAA